MASSPDSPEHPSGRGRAAAGMPNWLGAAGIVLAGAWALWPALRGPWLWDDDQYITRNLALHTSAGFWKNWIDPTVVNYFPLTTTVQWLQWQAWGGQPAGYHATNIVLHLLGALLLWRLLRKLEVPLAGWGGLIFAVHPIVVESVAWISELKNTLSLPFLLLAMIAYVEFDHRRANPAQAGRSIPPYAASLLFFLAAMLSKSTVVMFPVVILLYCWWRRGRISCADFKSSAAFFAVSLVLGLVTVGFEHHRSMSGVMKVPAGDLAARVGQAAPAVLFYFSKCVFPRGLSLIYPAWPVLSLVRPVLAWLLLAAAFTWLWSKRTTWGRHGLFGLGFFVLNLLPVIGIIPIAYQDISPVADHFAYLPLIGLIGLAAAILGKAATRFKPVWGLLAAIALILAIGTRAYAKVFSDAASLWARTARENPQSWIPENNLGLVLADGGRRPEAIAHFQRALQLQPDEAEVENNLGLALAGAARLPEAIAHERRALELNPDFPEASNNLGLALARTGQRDAALAEFDRALRARPDFPEAHRNRGLVLAQAGRMAEAVGELETAVRLDPGYAEAQSNLDLILRARAEKK